MQQLDFEQTAALDLAKHLDSRIETVLQDFMDRCCECGVTYEDATAKAITVLSHYFVRAALGIDASETEIVAACRWHYEESKKHGRAANPQHGAGPTERRRVSK